MKQHKFDLVMDYIDENIQSDLDKIKEGIINLIGVHSNTFGSFFSLLTDNTLGSYIRDRRLYYAAIELLHSPEKSICDVALDFGYADQSSFTRAFSTKYGFSPSDLRQKNTFTFLEDKKYHFEDFFEPAKESRSRCVLRKLERSGFLCDSDIDFMESIEHGRNEYGFDIDTCYTIADLAERLGVSVYALMENCFDLIVENQLDSERIPSHIQIAIDLGIRSGEDVERICEYYACSLYELNSYMVDRYYDSIANQKVGD